MPIIHLPPIAMTGRHDPEDGPLARRVYECAQPGAARAITGFASEAGVRRNKGRIGAKQGPAAIRQAFSSLPAPTDFRPFTDLGDIVVDGDDLEAGHEALGVHLKDALGTYERVIMFGGGHETAFGSYLGLRAAFPDKSVGIINLDAHLDLRNLGAAGASSGTPFNQIRRLDPDSFDYLCIGVARESNTEALFVRAQEWGVQIVFDTELIADPHAAQQKINAIAERSDIIYLTIDIDVLPHFQAPGVSAPAVRGVCLTTIETVVAQVMVACKFHGTSLPLADLVEVCPPHDKDNMTAKSAAILALQLLQ